MSVIKEAKIEDLIGLTLVDVVREDTDGDMIRFISDTGELYCMHHVQEDTEVVKVHDIVGKLQHLIDSPIITAKEILGLHPTLPGTHTLFTLSTAKGIVFIEWLGDGDGSQSTVVNFNRRVPENGIGKADADFVYLNAITPDSFWESESFHAIRTRDNHAVIRCALLSASGINLGDIVRYELEEEVFNRVKVVVKRSRFYAVLVHCANTAGSPEYREEQLLALQDELKDRGLSHGRSVQCSPALLGFSILLDDWDAVEALVASRKGFDLYDASERLCEDSFGYPEQPEDEDDSINQ